MGSRRLSRGLFLWDNIDMEKNDLRLLLVFEFTTDEPIFQASFEDMRGIPIPMIGDSMTPGKGEFKVVSRTFNYDKGLTVYYACAPADK